MLFAFSILLFVFIFHSVLIVTLASPSSSTCSSLAAHLLLYNASLIYLFIYILFVAFFSSFTFISFALLHSPNALASSSLLYRSRHLAISLSPFLSLGYTVVPACAGGCCCCFLLTNLSLALLLLLLLFQK